MPSHEREQIRNSYNEFQPGQRLNFTLQTLQPDGSVAPTERQITISDIRGGGFFGKVLVPENENLVIKTSLPDPWRHLWRIVNWGFKPFPTQSNELSAQLEHLAAKLIHGVLPVVSTGKFFSPASYGYTHLSTGYAQVVEKMDGRGPRFDLSENEFQRFRQAQKELLRIGLDWGLEQAGQIHPDNPFGMANLWFDEKRKAWIWLDTIPAIPHRGFVLPTFYFRFHKDMRHWFYQKETTFNRIHPGYFLTELVKNRNLFSPEDYQTIRAELELYGRIWEEKERIKKPEEKELEFVLKAFSGVFTETDIYRFLSDPAFRKGKLDTFLRIMKDPQYRTYWLNRNIVLKGVEQAKSKGLITEDEWKAAWQAVEINNNLKELNHKKQVLIGLQTYYLVTSEIINVIEGSIYLSTIFAEDKLSRVGLGIFLGWVLPSILRPAGTLLAEAVSKIDLKTAAGISALPKVGGYFAIPAQIGISASSETALVWHCTVRNIIATLSKIIRPWGGWNTQHEAELWERLGKKLERLGTKVDSTDSSQRTSKS